MSENYDLMKIQPSTFFFFLNGKLETLVSTNKADYISGETLLAHRKLNAEKVCF